MLSFQVSYNARLILTSALLLCGCDGATSVASAPPTPPEKKALTSEEVENINQTIAKCVQDVRGMALSARNASDALFFNEFDAYFDPVSRAVRNNGGVNGSRNSEFAFRKCMASMGWSI